MFKYDEFDRSVKTESHPLYSRYAALEACAQSLVAAAALGVVRRDWLVPFVRGVLKFDRTHGLRVEPLDLLVWCELNPEPPSRLFSFAMNLVDPPNAAAPAEVGPNTEVCFRYLLGLSRKGQGPSYFED